VLVVKITNYDTCILVTVITYLHKCTADIELKKINLKPGVDTPTYVKYFFFPHIQNQDSQTTTTSR